MIQLENLKPFDSIDYDGYAGAQPLPDGSNPLISRRSVKIPVSIIVTGVGDNQAQVHVYIEDDLINRDIAYTSVSVMSQDRAIELATKLDTSNDDDFWSILLSEFNVQIL